MIYLDLGINMLGVIIIIESALLFICNFICSRKIKYALFAFLNILFCIKFSGFNLFEIVYSIFDRPSILASLLAFIFIIKVFIIDFDSFSSYFSKIHHLNLKIHELNLKLSSKILLFLYGLVLFLSFFGILPFDFYYENNGFWLILFFVLLIAFFDNYAGSLLALSIGLSYFSASINMMESIICIYLWLYLLFFFIFKGIKIAIRFKFNTKS